VTDQVCCDLSSYADYIVRYHQLCSLHDAQAVQLLRTKVTAAHAIVWGLLTHLQASTKLPALAFDFGSIDFFNGLRDGQGEGDRRGSWLSRTMLPIARLIIPRHSSFADSFGAPQQLAPFLHSDLQQQQFETTLLKMTELL
jgi:hypothetical protein